MPLPFVKQAFDFISNNKKKQQTQPSYSSRVNRLVFGATIFFYIALMLLLLTGIVPIFRVEPDKILQATRNWISITFVVLVVYIVFRFWELTIRNAELEEDRKSAHHIRELQWQEIKNAQKREAIERGFRISDSCIKLLNSLEFKNASKEQAKLLLLQIFQDEEAVDNFIKYSNLSKFSTESLGQAKDDSVVLSAGEDLITVQDIRKIESAIGSRFSLFLSTLKDWSRINKNGVKALTPTETRMAKTKLIDILEIKFKKTKKLSGNFKEHFKQAFTGRM